MAIHVGRRASLEGWVSFESDPRLTRTKKRLYGRCLPCMTSLWDQLVAGREAIALDQAWQCWKVTVALADEAACVAFLEAFHARHPEEYVYGKFGTGGAGHKTHAVIFHMESADRRDALMALAEEVAAREFPGVTPVCSRGCAIPYQQLLGPWPEWREVSPIRHPERIDEVKKKLRQSLFRA